MKSTDNPEEEMDKEVEAPEESANDSEIQESVADKAKEGHEYLDGLIENLDPKELDYLMSAISALRQKKDAQDRFNKPADEEDDSEVVTPTSLD